MAKKSKPQIWIEYAAARAALGFLSALPFTAAERIGLAAGSFGYRRLRRLRRVGERNLEIAFPERTEEERGQILLGAFRNLGRVLAVFSRFDKLEGGNLDALIDHSPDPEFARAYEQTKLDGRGRIILGGHIGNWELQAFSYPLFFEPLTFLARRMDNPLIEKRVMSIRTRLGNRQIDKTNAAGTMLRTLRSGGTVGVLADVNSHPKEGVFVPFFGVPACTATGIAMLASRANAVIVPMFAMWDSDRRKYSIVHGDIIEPSNTGDRKRDIEETTARCVAATEAVIRRYPDQWIWIHRRWKTRPPGEKDLYE
jgi:KDO2-lipid IV(A) lauroyltransferase